MRTLIPPAVSCPLLTLLLAAPVAARAADLAWRPASGPLPLGLKGPAAVSEPVTLTNPLLRAAIDTFYELPWAPGEALLLRLRPGGGNVAAFGFWRGAGEFCLLTRGPKGWRLRTPGRSQAAAEPRIAYYGHEVTGQAVRWSGPARVLVVGAGGQSAIEVERVPLFEAGCTAMVLERGERELRQAREFLGWAKGEHPQARAAVERASQGIRAARAELTAATDGLLGTYTALPEPRYALEDMAWLSRIFEPDGTFKKMGYPDAWKSTFYGRPEFPACVAARRAAQEALWSERPEMLKAEAAQRFGPEAGFGASITHGLAKYRRDRPFPEPLRTHYRMCLARDEHESFQVVVAGLEQPVRNAQVAVAWEGKGPHPDVTLRPVGYVETRPDPQNLAEYMGWWPDPLMPPGPVDVAAGETQPIWGSVHAGASVPAGDHRAHVTVSADGMPPLRCELVAHVFDFRLGFTHLPSLLSLRLDSIKEFYRMQEVPREVKRRWYAFCLDYRMNPNNIYASEFTPEEEDLDFCVKRGFNAMVMTAPPLRTETRNNRQSLQVWVSDDNLAFRQVDGEWRVGHSRDGSIVITGLDVTARYLKVHSTRADTAYEFALPTLEPGRIVAYDGEQEFTGPAAYVGKEDGTKPLLSFGAHWGAALDYQSASLGVDLGTARHVTRLMLRSQMEGLDERVRKFYAAAKAHGLAHRAYVYGFDEWSDVKLYGEIRRTYEHLKRIAPGIKACSTVVHPVEPITRVIDAWCPALCYHYAGYQDARKRGQEVWYYAGGAPYDPFPTHELLDVPAVEARAFFWPAWRFQYTGWLHWELNLWANNLGGEKRWPEVPWNPARGGIRNGEVGRIYPGPDATPLPSVRLENMRDGIEDYDYFWLLNDAARKLPARDPRKAATQRLIEASIRELCPSRAHFERDPARVLQIHERLGRALESLIGSHAGRPARRPARQPGDQLRRRDEVMHVFGAKGAGRGTP